MTWSNFCLLLFGLAWAFTGIYRRYALNRGYVDQPNVRSSHYVSTARGGGIVFSALWLIMLGVCGYYKIIPGKIVAIFLPCILLALIGFRDDIKSVSAKKRLVVQTIACGISFYFLNLKVEPLLGITLPYWVFVGVMVIAVLWMTNLMNFMDGTDGLAGTQAVFILGTYGFIFCQPHIAGYSLAILCFGACATLLGFLTWNWPTANIFMGDSGSGFLGFMIAIMAIVAHKFYKIPYEIFFILSSLFWFDATVTLIRRILHKDKWTQAHCLHSYQRLTHVGWTHLQILMGATLINALMIYLAWFAFKRPAYMQLMLWISIATNALVYLMIEIYKPMYETWHKGEQPEG